MAKIQLYRCLIKEQELKKLTDIIKQRLKETEDELDSLDKINNELHLVQQLTEFVDYYENYSTIAKMSDKDVVTMRNLRDSAQSRDDRCREALELVCQLLDSYVNFNRHASNL